MKMVVMNSTTGSGGSRTTSVKRTTPYFTITWTNLSYSVKANHWTKILNHVSGHLNSGEVVGLMGASGSGKTVLMECIVGKRKTGVSGSITFFSSNSKVDRKGIKVSYIPQDETLIRELTVRELLTFASKIQNRGKKHFDHDSVVLSTLKSLGLEQCANNLSGRCSGGQQKRISVALELLASPDVLIFDEPTSGLDSAACVSVIELLSRIARGTNNDSGNINKKVAIMVSIHQPVLAVFQALDRIYCLTMTGGAVFYDGSPLRVSSYLQTNLSVRCELEDNPADVMMEASCRCFGRQVVEDSVEVIRKIHRERYWNIRIGESRAIPLDSVLRSSSSISLSATLLLIYRNMLINMRDPLIVAMRFTGTAFAVVLCYLVFGEAGSTNSCPPSIEFAKRVTNETSAIAALAMTDLLQVVSLMGNVSCLYFICLMAFLSAVAPNVFQIPRSHPTTRKEVFNKWYSIHSYVISITITDGFFCTFFNTFLLTVPFYLISNQYREENWRMWTYCTLLVLYGMTCQAVGHTILALTVKRPTSGIFGLVLSMLPLLLTSGAVLTLSELKYGTYYVTYFNIIKWCLEGSLAIIYGHDRCGPPDQIWAQINETRRVIADTVHDIRYSAASAWVFLNRSVALDNNLEDATSLISKLEMSLFNKYLSDRGNVGSQVMPLYDLEDDDAWKAFIFLAIHMVAWRVLSVVAFHRAVDRSS